MLTSCQWETRGGRCLSIREKECILGIQQPKQPISPHAGLDGGMESLLFPTLTPTDVTAMPEPVFPHVLLGPSYG